MPKYDNIIEKLPEHERPHVNELAENALFMRAKLEETRVWLKNEEITIPYDNGGGQSGIRANPAYGEYEKLLKAYVSTLDALRGMLDKSGKPEAKQPIRVAAVAGRSKWKTQANG